MKDAPRITPFQLTGLLLACRLFTVLTWTPREPEAGSLLWSIFISPAIQLPLVLLLLGLFRILHTRGSKWLVRGVQGLCWLVCLTVGAITAASCGGFLADAFYGGGRGVVMTVLLAGAAALAVTLGPRSFGRAAPGVFLLAVCGLAALVAGAAGTMHLGYFTRFTTSWSGVGRLVFYQLWASPELLALPLLQPHCTKPLRRSAIAGWLSLSALCSLAVTLSIMGALGHYAAGRQYPVLALARAASLPLAERMDAVLMGVWVLLGLVRVTLWLWLACDLWGHVVSRPEVPPQGKTSFRRPALHGAAACLGALLLLFTGCGAAGESIGRRTVVTLLELEQTEPDYTLRVEYRRTDGREGDTVYGVYQGTGDNLWQAIGEIERTENVRLYLDNCRVVSLVVPVGSDPAPLLEELDWEPAIRPLTRVLVSRSPPIEAAPEKKEAAMTGALGLFGEKGGSLGGRYTLKDALACARDPALALVLPLCSWEAGSPAVEGLLVRDGATEAILRLDQAALLPLWDAVEGSQRLTLPESGATLELTGLYSTLSRQGSVLRVTLWPWAGQPVGSPGDRAQADQAGEELSALCQSETQKIVAAIQDKKMPDFLGLGKYLELTGATGDLTGFTVKVVAKPALCH